MLGLDWVNFQVLRRTAATLMNQVGVDGVARQQDAVNALEDALRGAKPECDGRQFVLGF
jgi:hypothetical protein